jgi:hypothetical protein
MQDASYFLRQAERLQQLAGQCSDRAAAAQLNLIADELLDEAARRATRSSPEEAKRPQS